jgi:hypothetical protein
MHKMNIIGFDRPWREQRQLFFVAKGDLKGYSKVMRDADLSKAIPDFLSQTIELSCGRIRHSRLEQGDSILLCDESPFDVLDAIDAINKRIEDHYPKLAMRFAGSAGYIEFDEGNVSGLAILEAARVEPHVPPGRFFITGEFRDAIRSLGLRNLQMDLVKPSEMPNLPEENGKFNFAKSGKEEPLWRELYSISRSSSFLGRMLGQA